MVSVIIPVHNSGHYLKSSMESVMSQTYRDFEVIIVDDGSTDDTGKIAEYYAKTRGVKHVRHKTRKGLSSARNSGISAAGGTLVAFLDADDIFLKNKLERQVKCFEKNPLCDISYTNAMYFKEGGVEKIISTHVHFSGDIFYYLKRSNFITASTVMVRKKILEKLKFNEGLKSHEDWALYLGLAFQGTRFYYVDEPLSKIRIRASSLTSDTGVMDESRREVGLKAKSYWDVIKKNNKIRYLKAKTRAFFIGFPRGKRFNRPIPRELL